MVTGAALWPWVGAGRALYWGDFGVYFQPLLHFQREQLRMGTTPLWNPTLFCGTPFAGNPQTGPLYPFTLLLLPVLPASRFLTLSCAAHVFLAGAFFYAWLRMGTQKLAWWPSLLGATAYMLGGYLVTKAQYPNMLQALAWTPLVLLWTERMAARPGARAALGLGLGLGMQLLASHAQITLYTVYLALALGAWRLRGTAARAWLRAAGWGAAGALLGLGLACGQWLPVVEARRGAARQILTLARVDRLRLPFAEWTNFALPHRFGSPLLGDWSGAAPMWETACYAGTLTLALALFALLRGLRAPQRRGETAFWVGVFALSAWLATGTPGGLFPLAYAALPGMTLFHDPARLLLGAAVALPVLGAHGLQGLLEMPGRARPRAASALGAVCVALLALDLGQYARHLYPTQPVAQLENLAALSPVTRALQSDPALASGAGRILCLGAAEADAQFQSWTDYEQNAPRYLTRLADTSLPNLPALSGLAQAGGYEPLALRGSARLASKVALALQSPQTPVQKDVPALLNTLAVRDVVTYAAAPPKVLPGLTPLLTWDDADGAHHGCVYRNPAFVPRAHLFLPSAPPALVLLPLAQDTPDLVAVTVPPHARPGVVVLADTLAPGWHARIDGQEAPIKQSADALRAVPAPPSTTGQRVVFTYRPVSYLLGFYVSGLTVALCVAGGVFFARRRPSGDWA